MRLTILLLLLMILVMSSDAQQTLDKTIIHNGMVREYRLYIPATYNGNVPVPLVFNLHGYTSNNIQQELYGNFKNIADTANFIICLPNGTFDAANNRFWNAGFGSAVDDIGFLMSLLDTLQAQYQIDPARVYSTGMSNGGFMSFTLACACADRIAAIASVTGSMTILQHGSCMPARPVPVMQIHGTADLIVPYNGNTQFLHIDSLISFWYNRNGCSGNPIVTPIPDINTSDGCTATRFDYTSCLENTEVVLYKINGGGHTWPGSPINAGVTNRDFNASLEIWKFFAKHRHPHYQTVVHSTPHDRSRVFPNPFHDRFKINLTESKHYKLQITDLSGKILLTGHLDPSETPQIAHLPSGLYLLIIYNESEYWVEKIIKQ